VVSKIFTQIPELHQNPRGLRNFTLPAGRREHLKNIPTVISKFTIHTAAPNRCRRR
jgi:hypothetical protein